MNFQLRDQAVNRETHVVEVLGDADLYSAPEFKERIVRLIEGGNRRIVVDLSKATFVDSTILGVLVGAMKRLRSVRGAVAVVAADDPTRRIFEITGLDRVFKVCDTREEALQATADWVG